MNKKFVIILIIIYIFLGQRPQQCLTTGVQAVSASSALVRLALICGCVTGMSVTVIVTRFARSLGMRCVLECWTDHENDAATIIQSFFQSIIPDQCVMADPVAEEVAD